MKYALAIASAALVAVAFAETAAAAASCSSWRATCMKRAAGTDFGPQCEAKFSACLSSGCFAESARYGGANHCGLVKK